MQECILYVPKPPPITASLANLLPTHALAGALISY
jgi:hypothetical protein